MRILYLHQYFNLPTDSGGTRSYEMARRLVNAGHEVFMITSDRRARFSGKGWFVTEEAGIEIHWLSVPYENKMSYLKRIKAFFKFAIAAAMRSAKISADVVFATSTPLTIAVPGIYAAKRQKIPMVFEVRDLWPELPIAVGALPRIMIPPARWLERFSYNNSERVIALSPGMKEGVVLTGYPSDKVTVIPNSSDIDLFSVPEEAGYEFRRRYQWLQDRPLILYAGTLGLINGVSWLAELAAQVQKIDPGIRFLVMGDGAECEKVRQTAERLGVFETNFYMMDPVPKKEMPFVLAAATVATSLFIDLPEMWANSANKFFDAFAASRPVAINYSGWQAELLKETGAGVVLPAHDISQAGSMLLDLINDQDQLDRAAAASRKLAEIQFDREVLAKKLEGVLIDALESCG